MLASPPAQLAPALPVEARQILDQWLVSGSPDTPRAIMHHGDAGLDYVVSRVPSMAEPGPDASLGWSAFHVLPLLSDSARAALDRAQPRDPVAVRAISFARDWVNFRCGHGSPSDKRAFADFLDRLIQQPESRGEFILTWIASENALHGQRRMQIYGNGYRLVAGIPRGGATPLEQGSNLDPQQMGVVMESLRHGAVWLLRQVREQGLPDELRPTLHVRLGAMPGLDLTVQMWNGEWRAGPSYYLADLLDGLLAQGAPAGLL